MRIPYYLKIGRASDLKDKKERRIFRALEIFPGALSWLTLLTIILLSWLKPVWISIFVIGFIIYWISRTFYFSFNLSSSYKKMRQYEKIDWIDKLNQLPARNWNDIYHLIIFPMYKEPLSIVKDSFLNLMKTDYPKNKMIVVLAAEEEAGEEARKTAGAIEQEFKNNFFKLILTVHPNNLPGELQGKGANETWAAKKIKELVIDPLKLPHENIIVSSLDVDTCVFPKYFSCLTYHYLTEKEPWKASYQPIPLFINNVWQAPPISRVFSFSATFWQMMCQERPEKLLTFSSHSMSFKALADVDFKQTNVVSDDSRIFWQCYLAYDGNYRVVPLYYPISMDVNAASSFFGTMKNIYKQQRRWAYGVCDVPYFIFSFLKNKKIPLSKKIFPAIWVFEGFWSWSTNSIIIFILGWLPLILGGNAFSQTIISYNLPVFTSRLLTLGMIGLLGSIYFSMMLLPPRKPIYKKRRYLFFALEWFLLPIVMIFLTSFPAIEAQTRLMLGKYMGFWSTPKARN